MELKEIKLKDIEIRDKFFGKNWDELEKRVGHYESQLMRKVLSSQKEKIFYNGLLRRYPFIFMFENLESTTEREMRGDFLFTDGKENFLVVECKSLIYKNRNLRRRGRRKLEDQVPTMMRILKTSLKNYQSIIGIGVTDEQQPFYIHCSYKFADDNYHNLDFPNLNVIEKNPILALRDYCKHHIISEPEFKYDGKKMEAKIIIDDQEYIGRSHRASYSERYNQLNAAHRLCRKMNIPHDAAIIYYEDNN